MKLFLVACFVGAVLAAPYPEDDSGTVEFIVNGVPDGQALELGNILGIKVNEHVNGVLASSSDPLHPYTAVGIAEAAAAAAADVIASPIMIDNVVAPEPVVLPAPVLPAQEKPLAPEPVVLPAPVFPVVIPQPVVLPEPSQPVVIPEPVVLPPPAVPVVIPEPVVLPNPAQPVVLPAPATPEVHLPEIVEQVPVPAPQIANGEVFNNGVVQVHLNTPEEPTMLSTIQSWFNMVINYFNGDVQTSQQII